MKLSVAPLLLFALDSQVVTYLRPTIQGTDATS
jgi:hypothetical protein